MALTDTLILALGVGLTFKVVYRLPCLVDCHHKFTALSVNSCLRRLCGNCSCQFFTERWRCYAVRTAWWCRLS